MNGGGRIEREYGLGRGTLDLTVLWRAERHLLEVKIRRDTETERDALDQLVRYLDHAGLAEGWLVLFDLRKGLSWGEKIFMREVEHEGEARPDRGVLIKGSAAVGSPISWSARAERRKFFHDLIWLASKVFLRIHPIGSAWSSN